MAHERFDRRTGLKGLGAMGAAAFLGGAAAGEEPPVAAADSGSQTQSAGEVIARHVRETPLIDTHEHLLEEMIALAKQYPNALVDMCWAWIINPIASKEFLKRFLLTAPANKVLVFGGDYLVVEPVLGHALLARRGITLALSELVDEGWLRLDDALQLVEPLLNGNARTTFDLAEKRQRLEEAPWAGGG